MHRIILAVLVAAALLCLVPVYIIEAKAHDWYTTKKDPVYRWGCCGGNDCARWTIRPGSIKAMPSGFHIQLTLEETLQINPHSQAPIDALIDYPRVQPSEDGDWHLCVMPSNRSTQSGGIYCLFQPPST